MFDSLLYAMGAVAFGAMWAIGRGRGAGRFAWLSFGATLFCAGGVMGGVQLGISFVLTWWLGG